MLATYAGQPRWQRRDASSDYSGNQLIALVGLGDATVVDTVRIEWPSGTVQELHGIAPKQTLTVTEPARLKPTGRGTFQIRCWKGQKFEVQASADLSAWMSLGVVTNETGTLLYTDPEAGTVERRFYRVVAN